MHRPRSAEQVTLVGLAALAGEKIALRGGFHALGDHRQPETLREIDDGAGDGRIVGAVSTSRTNDWSIFSWSSGSRFK
jgi:hypothetical protein